MLYTCKIVAVAEKEMSKIVNSFITLCFRFEACWPAMAKDAHGVVFVYNPDVSNHDKELENW